MTLNDYAEALEGFFAYITQSGLKERIIFGDYYDLSAAKQSGGDSIEVFDPVNSTNNVAGRYDDGDRLLIVKAAQQAFDALSEAHYATSQGRSYDCWRERSWSRFWEVK